MYPYKFWILEFGPLWSDLPGIDCCHGNIPVGKPVVLPSGKIGLGQGF